MPETTTPAATGSTIPSDVTASHPTIDAEKASKAQPVAIDVSGRFVEISLKAWPDSLSGQPDATLAAFHAELRCFLEQGVGNFLIDLDSVELHRSHEYIVPLLNALLAPLHQKARAALFHLPPRLEWRFKACAVDAYLPWFDSRSQARDHFTGESDLFEIFDNSLLRKPENKHGVLESGPSSPPSTDHSNTRINLLLLLAILALVMNFGLRLDTFRSMMLTGGLAAIFLSAYFLLLICDLRRNPKAFLEAWGGRPSNDPSSLACFFDMGAALVLLAVDANALVTLLRYLDLTFIHNSAAFPRFPFEEIVQMLAANAGILIIASKMAPGSFNGHGIGTRYYGNIPTQDGYQATKWFVAIFFPLLPIYSAEVLPRAAIFNLASMGLHEETDPSRYRLLPHMNLRQVILTWLTAIFIVCAAHLGFNIFLHFSYGVR